MKGDDLLDYKTVSGQKFEASNPPAATVPRVLPPSTTASAFPQRTFVKTEPGLPGQGSFVKTEPALSGPGSVRTFSSSPPGQTPTPSPPQPYQYQPYQKSPPQQPGTTPQFGGPKIAHPPIARPPLGQFGQVGQPTFPQGGAPRSMPLMANQAPAAAQSAQHLAGFDETDFDIAAFEEAERNAPQMGRFQT